MVHAYAFEHADRQDLFQEIAIQVWHSVDAFRGDSSVPTWRVSTEPGKRDLLPRKRRLEALLKELDG